MLLKLIMGCANTSNVDILEQIKGNPVLIYSLVQCPYCIRAKEALTKMGVHIKVLEIDSISDGDSIQKQLKKLTGQETVPNIFIGGRHIGGNSELQEGLKNGSIQEKLREARVSFD